MKLSHRALRHFGFQDRCLNPLGQPSKNLKSPLAVAGGLTARKRPIRSCAPIYATSSSPALELPVNGETIRNLAHLVLGVLDRAAVAAMEPAKRIGGWEMIADDDVLPA